VKRELAVAGYRGEPVAVLGVSDNTYFAAISQVGADQLRKAGMNVDLRSMDFTSMIRRRLSKDPPDKGGWNVFFSINDGLFTNNPRPTPEFVATVRVGCPDGRQVQCSRHYSTGG
jgi:peptide/nickel transport system substrate-binding protein